MTVARFQATRDASNSLVMHLQQRVDVPLCLSVLALLSLGLVMVASASIGLADGRMGQPFHFLYRQAMHVALGAVLAVGAYHLRLAHLQNLRLVLLLAAYALLLLVLIPGIGKTVNGSTRWIPLGFFNLQVSEVAKLLICIYLAAYLARHGDQVRQGLEGFIKPLLLLGLASIPLLAQPDFGAVVVIMGIGLGMLFMGGVRLWQFVTLAALVVMGMIYLVVQTPYRLARLTGFLDPWTDPFNTGFQLTQSLIAIGSGSWFGVGLGGSVQKLFYLPEAHNDFIFAILGEELGLVGIALVILLFATVVWRAFHIARVAEDAGHWFGAHLAYGIGIWIGMQSFFNMGVTMGLLPTKGLTLPLMSYGGSSMLVTMVAIGLLARVHRETALSAREPIGKSGRSAT